MPRVNQHVPIEDAVQHLHHAFGPLFALDDMAQRFGETQLSHFTNQQAIEALLDKVDAEVRSTVRRLPKTHRARAAAEKVGPLAIALRAFVARTEDGGDGYLIPKDAIGAGMLAIVRGIGSEIERTELACGRRRGFAGYLCNTALDPARP